MEKEKKKEKKKRGEWSQKLQLVGPSLCVYLQKCHHNSVSITWKHIKFVFNLYNSSLKNQIIKLWKQKLKTSSNKPFSHGTHIFWVMGDGNTKTKQPLIFLFHSFSLVSFRPCLVMEFKQWKLLFKHYNMYFHTFFHSRIFSQNLNNITINLLPNGPLVSWPSSVSHLCLSLNFLHKSQSKLIKQALEIQIWEEYNILIQKNY